MAHVISDACICCGACTPECPVGAIIEGDGQFSINPDECIDCAACVDICPTSAISAE